MTVIDHEPSGWFLLRDGARLLLDVNCSHGAVGYSFLVALNDAEVQTYEVQGRNFISRLAYEIHYSAPGVRGNTSPYRERGLIGAERQKADEVILAWVTEHRGAP